MCQCIREEDKIKNQVPDRGMGADEWVCIIMAVPAILWLLGVAGVFAFDWVEKLFS